MFHSIYFGKISKEETEKILESYGRDGSFLARDSETLPGVFCLCVRRNTFVHTYRMYQSAGKWAVKTLPTVTPQFFESLDKLIGTYRKDLPDNMVPLLYPLEKATLLKNSRSNECLYLDMS